MTLVRRHRTLTAVLTVAVVLRVLAVLAYRPVLEFYGDSYAYLRAMRLLAPPVDRPFGYAWLLLALRPFGSPALVAVVQHALGLAVGVALYALLRHRGLPAWLGVLGAAPVLLDAYQVDVEQFLLTETQFDVLLVGALLALLWARRPGPVCCCLAGLLLAATTLTRTAALAVGVLAFGYLLLRRVGVRRLALYAAGFALPLVAYAGWYDTAHGSFSLTGPSGRFLYARVAQFADCGRIRVTRVQAVLCSPHPPSERPGPNYYLWDPHSPRLRLAVPPSEADAVLGSFARKVIAAEPGRYAAVVGGDLVHYVAPGRWTGRRDWPVGSWRFPDAHTPLELQVTRPYRGFANEAVTRRWSPAPAAVLRGYQRDGFTPGPLLGAFLAVALGVAVVGGRGRRRARADCLFLGASAVALLLVPAATACFDYRYLLPTLVLLPPAAALGLGSLRRTAAGTGSGTGTSSSWAGTGVERRTAHTSIVSSPS